MVTQVSQSRRRSRGGLIGFLMLLTVGVVMVAPEAPGERNVVSASPCPSSNPIIQLTVTYSAPNCVARYDFLGSAQSFVVPAGVTSLTFQVVAASGGRHRWNGSANSASLGGNGGSVAGTLAVTPATTLNLYVGGQGGSPTAGWNGGGTGGRCTLCDPATPISGGGGGASDIRIGGTALANRRVTAGGGGGAGGYGAQTSSDSANGGGNGGATAYNVSGVRGATGLAGADSSSFSEAGGGATPIAGGLKGQHDVGENHQNGSLGSGGNGRSNLYAGAGGGGHFGGGGANAGGGGGGSSYVDTSIVTGDSYASTNVGNGFIVLTYAAPFPSVTISTASSSPSNATTFTYSVTFSAAVDASTLSGTDFSNAGAATGCVFSTSPSSGSATTFTLTVASCADGVITPRLAALSVTDGSGVAGPSGDTNGNSVTKDTTAPSAPGVPDLAAASDTGRLNSDDVTSDTTPTFSVSGGSSGDVATISATNGSVTRSCSYTIGSTTSCDLSPALTDGTWSVSGTLTDPAGNVSPAGLSGSLTLDTAPPSAPAAPDLVASSDTGSSDTDNLTNDTTPALSIPGANTGETVEFTATQGATTRTCSYVVGVASSCDISPALGTGAWSVTARVTDTAGNQSVSGPATSLSIDTTAPSAPGAPDLAASSDLGSSSTDNLTSDMTPTMSASGGTAGDTMTITATQGATTRSCSYVVGTASSCDLPTLGDGTWTVAATLTDQAGNVSSAGSSLSIQIDGTAPSFSGGPDLVASSDSGASNSDNLTNDTTPTLSIPGGSTGDVATISATNGSVTRSCSYTIGSTTSCDLSPALTDGTWSVSGTLTDPAGNVVATVPSLSLSVDATAPSPASVDLAASSDTGSSTTDDLTSDSSPTISVPGLSVGDQVTVTAQRGSTVVNCSYTVGAASSCDLPMIADGTWSVTAAITDAAGNAGATVAPLSISIDTTGPAPPGALDLAASSDTGSSSTDDATSDTTPSMSVPGGTAGDTATVTATNGTQTVSCTFVVGSASSCDLPALTDGTWQVSGTFTDPAGNTSTAGPALPLVVDTTPPAIGGSPDLLSSSDTGVSSTDNVTSDTTPLIEIPGVEDGASVTVTATKGSSTVTCTFVASVTLKGCDLPALTDGTWSLTASATDAAGNTASTAQPLSLKIDTAKPFGDPVNTSGGTPGVTTTTTAPRRPSSGATTTTTPRRPSNSSSPTTTVTRRPGSRTPTTAPKPTTTTTVAPSPFGMPDLRTESDTGADRGDNLTNATSPLVGIDGLGDGDTVTLVAKRGARTVQCSYVVGAADGCRLEGLADGEWKVGARVVDLAGNEAEAPETLALSIDSLGPADQLSLSTTDDPNDGSMFVDVAGGDDGRSVTVTASNGNDTVTCSFVVSADTRGCLLEGMTPGEWKITGVAFDEAGNASGEATALDAVVTAPTTVPPPTNPPATVPAVDQDGGGSDAARTVDPMSTNDTIALLASMLALLAISRRGAMGEPRRLDSDERQSTEVTGFAAGAGSGGLDARRDRFVPPNIPRLDRTMYEKARDWSPLSPALGRSLDDGSYLRALVGVFWSLLPVAGGVLGVVAALDTESVAMLPALGIFVALLVVGTLDAFAGLVGVATYAVTLLAGGGLGTADSVRGFFGMAAPMFLVGLVASVMRPFRRETGEHPVWNRSADAVLIALVGAWAAGTMYQAVPHLSGYDVEWSGRVGTVELVALVTLVVRYGLENIARLVVADRLRAIENETLPEPGEAQLTVSRIVRAALFAFVAYVFVGGNVWLAAGTAMFLVPKILEPLTDRLPNAATLYRFLPRDLVRTVLMLFVMLWWGGLVADAVESNEVQWAFVLMSIPGIAVGVADWFARDGKSWPSTVVTRVFGVVTLLIGVAFVRGWIF